ncbi:MAG: hypothetical protein WBX01_00805 [Nitrososphaeraceae archaeon]
MNRSVSLGLVIGALAISLVASAVLISDAFASKNNMLDRAMR